MKKAIFIDKDGTLIYDVPYNTDPNKIELTDKAIDGLKKLVRASFKIFIVTNQQGIALGYFDEKDLVQVKEKIESILMKEGIKLSGFYYCPHHKNDNCICRKPKPGMIKEAAEMHKIDLKDSWMIGDLPSDIEAGKEAGCKTILFEKGYENNWEFTKKNRPDHRTKNIDDAANIILSLSL